MGMSTKRYLPASGTAGLARSLVKGNSRVPAPPPMMMERVSSIGVFRFITCYGGRASYWLNYYCPIIRLLISSLTAAIAGSCLSERTLFDFNSQRTDGCR
jgi:hypothetical protein